MKTTYRRTLYVVMALVLPLVSACASDALRSSDKRLYTSTIKDLPTANVKLDGRNGESLRRSLALATRSLTQAQRESFVADFMGSNRVSWCLETGKIFYHDSAEAKTKQQCIQLMQRAARIAKPYINDERMDADYARRVTSLLSGSRDLGRTRAESFAVYVDQNRKYFDGLTVAQIQENAEHYKAIASDPSKNTTDFLNRTVQNVPFGKLFLREF